MKYPMKKIIIATVLGALAVTSVAFAAPKVTPPAPEPMVVEKVHGHAHAPHITVPAQDGHATAAANHKARIANTKTPHALTARVADMDAKIKADQAEITALQSKRTAFIKQNNLKIK